MVVVIALLQLQSIHCFELFCQCSLIICIVKPVQFLSAIINLCDAAKRKYEKSYQVMGWSNINTSTHVQHARKGIQLTCAT